MSSQPSGRRLIYTTGNSFNNTGDLAMVEGYITTLEERVPGLQVTLLGHEVPRLNKAFSDILSRGHKSAASISTVMTQFDGVKWLGSVVKAISKKEKPRMAYHKAEAAVKAWDGKPGTLKGVSLAFRAFADLVASHDAVVIGGGGYLNDVFNMAKPTYMTALIAKQAGKPVFAVGQSIGPFTQQETIDTMRKLASALTEFELREGAGSYEQAKKIGIDKHCHVGADSAILAHIASPERAREIIRDSFGGVIPPKIVSLNPRYLHDANPRVTLPEHIELFTKLTQRLIDDLGVHVLATSTLFSAKGAEPKPHHDPSVANEIKKRLTDPSKMAVLEQAVSVAEYKAVQAEVNLCIGAGYHPCCLALAAGTPTLVMFTDDYNELKNGGMAKLFGVAEWLTNPYLPEDMENVPKKAAVMLENEKAIRTGLIAKTAELKDTVLTTLDKVVAALGGKSRELVA